MKISSDPRVEKEIRLLPQKDASRVVKMAETFGDYGFSLTGKYLKKLSKNLWELRSARWRLLFGIIDGDAVVVNIFLKKTQKTPMKEMKLAIKRLKEYE